MDESKKHPFEVESEELELFAEEVPDSQEKQHEWGQCLACVLTECTMTLSSFSSFS
jgi:hypothetical protein